MADGIHNLKLEVEDRAGNISHDFLLDVLMGCEPKLVATHAEDMLVMVDEGNRDEMVSVLEGRMGELSPSQGTRVRRVLKRLS